MKENIAEKKDASISSEKKKQKIVEGGYIYVGDSIVGRLNEHSHPPSATKVEVSKIAAKSKILLRTPVCRLKSL